MYKYDSPWTGWAFNIGVSGICLSLVAAFIDAVIQISSEHGTLPEPNPILFFLVQAGMFMWLFGTIGIWPHAWRIVFPRPLDENQYLTLVWWYLMTVAGFVMVWGIVIQERRQHVS